MLGKALKIVALPILYLTLVFLVFSLFEGLSNIFFVASEIISNQTIAERVHTKYDPEIGWINIPNIHIGNMYGNRKYLLTNSQSFRNNEDFAKKVPAGKARIICSGDSFTLGYGVDNDHPWCQQLLSLNRDLQTVNMGQGGYGIDQMYLWYKRNNQNLDHNIHIFAFITGDFERMKTKDFFGYGKPILELKDDDVVVKNVPAPRRYFFTLWLNDNIRTIEKLHAIQLIKKLRNKINFQERPVVDSHDKNDEQVLSLVWKIFAELHRMSRENNASVVFVYLPTRKDYAEYTSDPWRRPLHEEMKKRGLLFIDLIDEFRKLPLPEVEKLFIGIDAIPYVNAAGHYTEEGNAYIAKSLYRRVLGINEIASKLPGQR